MLFMRIRGPYSLSAFATVAVAALACIPRPAVAQHLSRDRTDFTGNHLPSQTHAPPGSLGATVGGGIALGAAGLLLGGLIGASAVDCYECEMAGAFYGSVTGATLGMALGVHLGNKRQGSFVADLLVGAVVSGAGTLVLMSSETPDGWLVALPIVQLAGMVAVERGVRSQPQRPPRRIRPVGIGALRIRPVWTREGRGIAGSFAF
jgi:hypothetical protein